MTPDPAAAAAPKKRDTLYLQVLAAIVLGAVIGYVKPPWGVALQPLGDGYIKLIKMLIAPIIFTTVVAGIAGMGDLKRMGRVGGKALIYFEIVSTLALFIGLIVANVFQPGASMHADPATLDTKQVAGYINAGREQSTIAFLLNIIPKTFVGAFAEGDILQVLLIAILTGCALGRLGEHGRPVVVLIDQVARMIFGIVGIVTRFAPLGAFGAMGFTIGKFGVHALVSLGQVLACVYLTCFLFIALVLGTIARLAGFSLWRVLKYIREEIFIAVGTSSSESALPGLMAKMERIGCARPVVGIVVPAGYSFNLDGTCIYLTCAALFVAQATDTPLTLVQQLGLLAVMLLTSKGAAGITGSGFIVLAATLETTGKIPPAGLAIIYGIDRFMSEIRTFTNLVGNTVATLVVSKWDGAFDETKAGEILAGGSRRQETGDGRQL
ncbi:MAG TPA: dicarboxylate/amino acid:cation symporter [Opitutaceae bacterium]|nr:dicarboxylate/amino acid:cation symporter [Opitutaceae bacterium]